MIIEIPKGYTYMKEGNIIAFEENGILKMQRRHGKFDEIMYDVTYQQKGRDKCYYCGRGGSFFKLPQSLYFSMFYDTIYILKHFFKTLILVLI